MKFYLNKSTGNVLIAENNDVINDESYKVLTVNTTDAAQEKHVPVVSVSNDSVAVSVGSVPHPMSKEHSIGFIILETTSGYQFRRLEFTDEPKAEFKLARGEKTVAVYEYCNLHGLWMCKI